MVQEILTKKKLASALFMDIKGTFDYVSKGQFIKQIIKLGID